jgi:hypothetical protein
MLAILGSMADAPWLAERNTMVFPNWIVVAYLILAICALLTEIRMAPGEPGREMRGSVE